MNAIVEISARADTTTWSADKPLRMMVVHPGASWAVHDVFCGVVEAFQRRDDVKGSLFRFDRRVEEAKRFFDWKWKQDKKVDHGAKRFNTVDHAFYAGVELVHRCLDFDVDVLLVISGLWMHPTTMRNVRKAGKTVALLLTESPYDDEQQKDLAANADVVWVNDRVSLPEFEGVAPVVSYLPAAFDPTKHTPKPALDEPEVRAHDVVFVGTSFSQRIEMLSKVDWSGIDLGLYGNWPINEVGKKLQRFVCGGVVPNEVTRALYRASKIGLNIHRTQKGWSGPLVIDRAESINPRMNELAACGTFTISDERPELTEVFGDLVPTFTDAATLEHEIRKWLADDVGRQSVAAKLPACVSDRTWDARVAQMLDDLAAAM